MQGLNITIRQAKISDAGILLNFITELADYEKAKHEVIASIKDIKDTLFDEDSKAKAIICEHNNDAIGFAVYFYNYSTWLGQYGLYLEDLYVSPKYRGIGAGKALLKHLAQLAVKHNCHRFEWSVLNWNQPAIDFYEGIGAKAKSEWVAYQLSGEALRTFASAKA